MTPALHPGDEARNRSRSHADVPFFQSRRKVTEVTFRYYEALLSVLESDVELAAVLEPLPESAEDFFGCELDERLSVV
jgi:hypothetical protein